MSVQEVICASLCLSRKYQVIFLATCVHINHTYNSTALLRCPLPSRHIAKDSKTQQRLVCNRWRTRRVED